MNTRRRIKMTACFKRTFLNRSKNHFLPTQEELEELWEESDEYLRRLDATMKYWEESLP